MYPSVKCPDCGTWWRGSEHRCPPRGLGGTAGQPAYPPYPYGSTGKGGYANFTTTTTENNVIRLRVTTEPTP